MGHGAVAARLETSPLPSCVCLVGIPELSEERGARSKKQKHDVKWDAVKNREVGILGLFAAEYGAYS